MYSKNDKIIGNRGPLFLSIETIIQKTYTSFEKSAYF